VSTSLAFLCRGKERRVYMSVGRAEAARLRMREGDQWTHDGFLRLTPKAAKLVAKATRRELAEVKLPAREPAMPSKPEPIYQTGYSGYESLAWAVITQAAYDIAALRRHGIFSRAGEIVGEWPTKLYNWNDGGVARPRYRPVRLEGLEGPADAERLREWWTGGAAQKWLELVNSPMSAQQLWERALRGQDILQKHTTKNTNPHE
jgi:hypothetical protein